MIFLLRPWVDGRSPIPHCIYSHCWYLLWPSSSSLSRTSDLGDQVGGASLGGSRIRLGRVEPRSIRCPLGGVLYLPSCPHSPFPFHPLTTHIPITLFIPIDLLCLVEVMTSLPLTFPTQEGGICCPFIWHSFSPHLSFVSHYSMWLQRLFPFPSHNLLRHIHICCCVPFLPSALHLIGTIVAICYLLCSIHCVVTHSFDPLRWVVEGRWSILGGAFDTSRVRFSPHTHVSFFSHVYVLVLLFVGWMDRCLLFYTGDVTRFRLSALIYTFHVILHFLSPLFAFTCLCCYVYFTLRYTFTFILLIDFTTFVRLRLRLRVLRSFVVPLPYFHLRYRHHVTFVAHIFHISPHLLRCCCCDRWTLTRIWVPPRLPPHILRSPHSFYFVVDGDSPTRCYSDLMFISHSTIHSPWYYHTLPHHSYLHSPRYLCWCVVVVVWCLALCLPSLLLHFISRWFLVVVILPFICPHTLLLVAWIVGFGYGQVVTVPLHTYTTHLPHLRSTHYRPLSFTTLRCCPLSFIRSLNQVMSLHSPPHLRCCTFVDFVDTLHSLHSILPPQEHGWSQDHCWTSPSLFIYHSLRLFLVVCIYSPLNSVLWLLFTFHSFTLSTVFSSGTIRCSSFVCCVASPSLYYTPYPRCRPLFPFIHLLFFICYCIVVVGARYCWSIHVVTYHLLFFPTPSPAFTFVVLVFIVILFVPFLYIPRCPIIWWWWWVVVEGVCSFVILVIYCTLFVVVHCCCGIILVVGRSQYLPLLSFPLPLFPSFTLSLHYLFIYCYSHYLMTPHCIIIYCVVFMVWWW